MGNPMKLFRGSRLALPVGLSLFVAILAILSSGCPAADKTAELRVIHLSPDAPAVDVWQRDPNTRLFTNLSFTDGTAYRTIDEDTYTFEVAAAGFTIEESVLTLENVAVQEDAEYTVAVLGFLNDLQAIVLQDDLTTPAQGSFRLRVIHAAPGVGEVDIWNVTDPEAPAPLVENVSFGQASDNLTLDAGAYVIGLDATGDEQPDLVFELPALTSGAIVQVFAVQDEDGNPFLLAFLRDGTTLRVDARPEAPDLENNEAGLRLVHLSPDAPAVDVWGPNETLVTGLQFGEGTGHLTVPADVDIVQVVPAGLGREEAVLTIENPGLQAGQFYTAVVYGELAEISAALLTDDLAETLPGAVRIRPVHAAVGVGVVDLWAARPEQAPVLAFEGLNYGAAGDYLELPAGNYSIGLDIGQDGLIDVTAPLGDVTAATVANVFAAIDGDGQVFFLVQENGRHTRIDATLEEPPVEPGNVLPLE